MTARVLFQPEARDQALAIDAWWRANRTASPDLFATELSSAIELLEQAPDAAPTYPAAGIPGLRRLALRGSRFHLYYVHDANAAVVRILAIWSAVRGSGPRLPR